MTQMFISTPGGACPARSTSRVPAVYPECYTRARKRGRGKHKGLRTALPQQLEPKAGLALRLNFLGRRRSAVLYRVAGT